MPELKLNRGASPSAPRPDAARTPQVPRTVLNFIEEEVHAAEQARRQYRAVAAASVAVFALVAGIGGLFRVQTAAAEQEWSRETARAASARAEIGQAISQASSGQIDPEADLTAHLASRSAQISEALRLDLDANLLLQGLLADLPAGVEVLSVELAGPVTEETPAAAPPSTTPPNPSASTTTTTTVPDSSPALARKVTLTAAAPNYAAALEWQRRLAASGLFTEAGVTLTVDQVDTGQTRVEFRVEGQANIAVLQSRRTQLLALLGQTPTPTPDAGEGTTEEEN